MRILKHGLLLACLALAAAPLRAEVEADTALDGSALPAVKALEAYPDVAAFEEAIAQREQACFDGSYGGSAASACPAAVEAWEGELARYGGRLQARLSPATGLLLGALLARWKDSDDLNPALLEPLLQRVQNGEGTMWRGPNADERDKLDAPVVKARALLLRAWSGMDLAASPQAVKTAGTDPKADAALNDAYKELRGHLDEAQRAALLAAQKAWLRARDQAFEMAGAFKDPAAAAALVNGLVEERAQTLRRWSEVATRTPDGDDSGGNAPEAEGE